MRKEELEVFRVKLQNRLEELRTLRPSRDVIAVQPEADQVEEVLNQTERDIAIHNLNRSSSEIRDIHSALERITDETFGACLECEKEIGSKRLVAMPWAPYCVRCQELVDQRDQERAA